MIRDKDTIERFLRRNTYLHIYEIGDLDDFFWPYTTWFAAQDGSEITELALLYTGQPLPVLLALTENIERMGDFLSSIKRRLPDRFYAHLSPGLEKIFSDTHHLESHGDYLKMGVLDRCAVLDLDCSKAFQLDVHHLDELNAFYDTCYPGNWFDPRMLETHQYFGLRKEGQLVSVAGIHVFSADYKVAALGNIATSLEERGKGFGRAVTGAVCRSLLKHVEHIGLNVKKDNIAAIACYKRLGFDVTAPYGEFMVQKH